MRSFRRAGQHRSPKFFCAETRLLKVKRVNIGKKHISFVVTRNYSRP